MLNRPRAAASAVFVSIASMLTSLLLLLAPGAQAQPTSDSPLAPPPNGVRSAESTRVALVGATIVVKPGETIARGALVMNAGVIEQVIDLDAAKWKPAPGFRVIDADGLFLTPAFIDAFVEVDAPKPDASAPGTHWNSKVTPQRDALAGPGLDKGARESLRKLGFGAAAISPKGGIFRGSAALVSLAEPASDESQRTSNVYRDRVYDAASFDAGGWGDREYPTSHMGAVALVRQTLSDADYFAQSHPDDPERGCLDRLAPQRVPLAFDVDYELKALSAEKVAKEFARGMILIASGMEICRLDPVVAMGCPIVLPLRFPAKPDLSSVSAIDEVELDDLMLWEQAPTLARRLNTRGAKVALTTSKIKNRSDFAGYLKRAIREGLTEDAALAMLTTNPAEVLGASDLLGTLEAGKRANIIVSDGPVLSEGSTIFEVYVDGQRSEIKPLPPAPIAGKWAATLAGRFHLDLTILPDNTIEVRDGDLPEDQRTTMVKAEKVERTRDALSFSFDHSKLMPAGTPAASPAMGVFTLSATIDNGPLPTRMIGSGTRADGMAFQWTAEKTSQEHLFDGDWRYIVGPVSVPEFEMEFTVKGIDIEAREGDAKGKATDVRIEGNTIFFTVTDEDDGTGSYPGSARLLRTGRLEGNAKSPDGQAFAWTGIKGKKKDDHFEPAPEDLGGYPFGAYAMPEPPASQELIVTGATLWTSGPLGVIEDGALVISNGKVAYAGPGASMPRVSGSHAVIDATGKHITPGLFDAHSHTGTWGLGTNEGTQACTAEVRIADDIDPGAVNWYRQLAGGVTIANSLHGSANPIGGQNLVEKLRWGARHPDEMHVQGAASGIKFALGENVKQSNWGERYSTRYPQTRMGVETFIRDRFTAAREYAAAQKDYAAQVEAIRRTKIAPKVQEERIAALERPRRDLELECLAEILAGTRLVHCHSYRQDEILMLCRIAQDFGFTIGTFQHGLEVYKVAEAVKQAAIGASLFSDWWAYKVEVQDAIPYAGPIQFEVGLSTSYNSDSDELARRMNVEAGKALKYAREIGIEMSPQDALNFVTINPAKQFRLDDRLGSLEAGKDADFVIWSADPLSSTSRCEATYIEGRRYFSLEDDARHRERIARERARLIQKILAEGKKKDTDDEKKDDSAEPGEPKGEEMVDSPPQGVDLMAWRLHMQRMTSRGLDPMAHTCGLCGCAP
ncbi:MAG: amidohydrolase family protein [Phycisphaerales bacterium]|jgi:N-acetylglucosamine-6-phosphate deacetylase|nr:amidohydrolase family protein [Phycisphaerales bacterium]